MIVEVEISVDMLFGQCIDQSLYDYRYSQDTGEPAADKWALSAKDKDIFMINLRTLLDDTFCGSLGRICAFSMDEQSVRFCVDSGCGAGIDTVGSRLKDILKAGMLRWWNEGKHAGLYEKYARQTENLMSSLRGMLSGITHRKGSY